MTKKATPPPNADRKAYWLITFVYYVEADVFFDTAIHDGTLTDFLLELNEHYQTPSLVCVVAVSKAQYAQLEAAMDAVDGGDDAEQTVEIGGGMVARIPPMDDDANEEGDADPEMADDLPEGEDEPGDAGVDPGESDEGDQSLEFDGPGLDDGDLDGEFDEL